MKPTPGQYEKYESDVNTFIQFILRFDISISEFPDTYSLSFEEMLPLLDAPAKDGSVSLRYFFTINECEYWEYDIELDLKFNLFKRGIKELHFWAEHGNPYSEHFNSDIKYLEKAVAKFGSMDFSKFTKDISKRPSGSVISGISVDAKSPPHHKIDKYRNTHLNYLGKAIELLKELIGVNSEREIKGINIKIPYRGSSDANIKQLFEFLQEKYSLKDQEHFIMAFTGRIMDRMYIWPQMHSTGLKLLIQGLIKEKCIEGIKTKTIPWKEIAPIFCNEDGIPYSSNLKSTGHKNYEDDTALLSAIKRMKGERTQFNIKLGRS